MLVHTYMRTCILSMLSHTLYTHAHTHAYIMNISVIAVRQHPKSFVANKDKIFEAK